MVDDLIIIHAQGRNRWWGTIQKVVQWCVVGKMSNCCRKPKDPINKWPDLLGLEHYEPCG